jgi:hypothetical protein
MQTMALQQRPWIIFARMSLYKAIHRTDNELPPAPRVKEGDTWRERRWARRVMA